jgi:hypothetical protein
MHCDNANGKLPIRLRDNGAPATVVVATQNDIAAFRD